MKKQEEEKITKWKEVANKTSQNIFTNNKKNKKKKRNRKDITIRIFRCSAEQKIRRL